MVEEAHSLKLRCIGRTLGDAVEEKVAAICAIAAGPRPLFVGVLILGKWYTVRESYVDISHSASLVLLEVPRPSYPFAARNHHRRSGAMILARRSRQLAVCAMAVLSVLSLPLPSVHFTLSEDAADILSVAKEGNNAAALSRPREPCQCTCTPMRFS